VQDHLIIVAGGVGDRMGAALPKQFLELAGVPIICRTVNRFLEYNNSLHITIVIHPEYVDLCKDLLDKAGIDHPIGLVEGGKNRFDSVKAGLDSLPEGDGIVAIHDSVRPFVSFDTIDLCFHTARAKGNAVPAISMFESLRIVEKETSRIVDRDVFRVVQTPQCFDKSLIQDAYQQAFDPSFTDDASVAEKMNTVINLVEGNRENIKITVKGDLQIAQGLVQD
jgi:2-C-methyl-D-erythritol 4-phosphate cytidylyltransferase